MRCREWKDKKRKDKESLFKVLSDDQKIRLRALKESLFKGRRRIMWERGE